MTGTTNVNPVRAEEKASWISKAFRGVIGMDTRTAEAQ